MMYTRKYINQHNIRQRAHPMNSATGYKSINRFATISKNGLTHVALFCLYNRFISLKL